MRPQPPCKDCQERRTFCHTECDKWAEYETQRNEYYDFIHRQKEDSARAFLIEQTVKRSAEYRKKNHK